MTMESHHVEVRALLDLPIAERAQAALRGEELADGHALQQVHLTETQHRVLRLLAAGLSKHEAGYSLRVTESAVKHHIETAYKVLGATSLTEAFLAMGWLRVPREDA